MYTIIQAVEIANTINQIMIKTGVPLKRDGC